ADAAGRDPAVLGNPLVVAQGLEADVALGPLGLGIHRSPGPQPREQAEHGVDSNQRVIDANLEAHDGLLSTIGAALEGIMGSRPRVAGARSTGEQRARAPRLSRHISPGVRRDLGSIRACASLLLVSRPCPPSLLGSLSRVAGTSASSEPRVASAPPEESATRASSA